MLILYSIHSENKEIKTRLSRKISCREVFFFFLKVVFLLEKFQLAANCTFGPSGEEQVANSRETGSAAPRQRSITGEKSRGNGSS